MVALRQQLCEDKGKAAPLVRVSRKFFMEARSPIVKTSKDVLKFVKVPKSNCPHLDADEEMK